MPRDVLNHFLRASLKVSTFRLTYRRAIGLVHAKVLFIDDFAIIHNERSRGRGESNAAPVSAFCPKERRPATARILRAHSQTRKAQGWQSQALLSGIDGGQPEATVFNGNAQKRGDWQAGQNLQEFRSG